MNGKGEKVNAQRPLSGSSLHEWDGNMQPAVRQGIVELKNVTLVPFPPRPSPQPVTTLHKKKGGVIFLRMYILYSEIVHGSAQDSTKLDFDQLQTSNYM